MTRWARTLRKVRGAPIAVKIAGVAALGFILVGATAWFAARAETGKALEAQLAREADMLTKSLAARLEEPLLTGNSYEVQRSLDQAAAEFSGLTWAELKAPDGSVTHRTGALDNRPVVSASARLLNGTLGHVVVGLDPSMVQEAVGHSSRVLLLTFALGTVLALLLTSSLAWQVVQPLFGLVDTAHLVRDGDLSARAHVDVYSDELGDLAFSFNEMLDALERSRAAVAKKEKERQQLLERLIGSEEEERARIARELHDGVGQSMSAALMALRMSKTDCRGHACGIEGRVKLATDEVRRISRALRPSVLDDYGLDSALERHASDVGQLSGLVVMYERICAGLAPTVAKSTETAIYRIAQEALNNVVRHADATRVSVILYRKPHELRLVVEDDGSGFIPNNGTDQGMGLPGMRDRARLLGGDLEVESQPGLGATVMVRIPVGEQEAERCTT